MKDTNKEASLPTEADILAGKSISSRFILGVFIGLAVIAPGISGSTVAIMLGLYAAMLYAMGHLFGDFRRSFLFLLPIGAGAVIGFLGGFIVVQRVFGDYLLQMVCLFGGLMIGALPAVTDEIRGEKPTALRIALLVLGVLIPVFVALFSYFAISPDSTADTFTDFPILRYVLYLPLGFAVSVTQLVPGLSATAILMAFGQFGPILNSVHLDYILENPRVLLLYLSLGVGFLLGLLSLARALSYLLTHCKAPAFFMIVGLSLGSVISMFVGSDMLALYGAWSASEIPLLGVLVGILCLAVGITASYLLVRYERAHKQNE